MFELAHLRAFLAVATDLHFGRAAARLNMTQPPLSRQIMALEGILRVPLFVRSTRTVRLTSAGHRFLPEARNILRQAEIAAEVARAGAFVETGRITIGLVGAATYDVLPRLVRAARARLPDVELSFAEMLTPEQVEALALRRIDIGLGRLPRGARHVQTAVIARERLVLVTPSDHPLAEGAPLTLRDLGDCAYIGYEPSEASPIYELLEHLFISGEFSPRVVQRSRQTQTILSLVEAGVGVALVPEAAQRACFRNVRFRRVAFEQETLLDMNCLWRDDNGNPALPSFRALIFETFWPDTAPIEMAS